MFKNSQSWGSVVFVVFALYIFGPNFIGGSATTSSSFVISSSGIDDSQGTVKNGLQAKVFAFAKLQPTNGRHAIARAAEFCTKSYSDMYQNPKTTLLMAEIYTSVMNRAIREEPDKSSPEDYRELVSRMVRKKFKSMKSMGRGTVR